jgi:signal transduction histidine kinase
MSNALRHELSCRFLQPILDLCDTASLQALCAEWGVALEQLRDQTNWVSLRFCEALVDRAAAHVGADELTERVTREAFSPKAMGFLYPLVLAFGSPRAVFSVLPRFVAQLNKVSIVEVRALRRGFCEIEYRPPSSEYHERSPLICRVRKAQLAASPTPWSLPQAQVEEKECQAAGGARCLYQVRWAERTVFWGLVLGACAGAGLGLILGAGPWVVATALAGAAMGAFWDQRREIAEHKRWSDEQAAALHDAADAAERRFVELERAKSEVDRQVEERTGELREASGKLQASFERLEELGRVKDEFLANVSHELRTPLTLIMAPLEELLAGRTASSREYLAAMHKNAVRLNAMVNDLLMLARLQAGQLRLSVEETDVGGLLQAAADQFRALAEKKSIRLVVEREEGCVAWLDPGRIEFVLLNLLSNAFKFTLAGGTVTLRVKKGDNIVVEVQDTGVGIAAELQPSLFERFNRYENPAVTGAAGAGIGLALVRELVELHGGNVHVESAPGRGSRFVLVFRLGREHLNAEHLERRQSDVPVPFGRRSADLELDISDSSKLVMRLDEGAVEAPPADAPRVLVAEDNPDMRRFIARVLASRYRVTDVEDGAKALKAVASEPPDLVLSDVMMPALNGYELCRRLKDDTATRLIPVILLTAKKERSLEGFEAGADDYLIKPFNAQELHARIDVHIRLRRLLRDRVHVEKLATLGSLAAGLAHEVRNPAGAILAGLPKVRRTLADSAQPRTLEMIDVAIDSAGRIARLVDDLLSLGQSEHDGVRLWDLHEGIEAAIRILGQRAQGVPVEIRKEFAFHGKVRCRPDALNQIFLNLIDNALHAVENGGIVEVRTREEDGGVAVLVADSGKGVPQEVRSRIFEPFFTTRAPGNGTGLGLHISQRVAVDHGGRLELVNADGWGACFRLWLPREERGQ